ncbi:MAG TPA: hypothetical protein VF267_14220 [Gammaproteobacteria bacterium]
MNTTVRSVFAAGMLLLAACATGGGHPALADAGEPHATLHELLQADISNERVRTRLARIDGRWVVEGDRRTLLLEPGRHTLGFELDVESLARFESGHGRHFPDPSGMSASVSEKSVEVDLEAGETYTFGAYIEDFDYADWEPFIVKSDTLD